MNYKELKMVFAACRKLNIETVEDLEQFKQENKCKTNNELLDAIEKAVWEGKWQKQTVCVVGTNDRW